MSVEEFVSEVMSGNNYEKWRQQMLEFIKKEDLVCYIDGTVKAPPKTVNISSGDGTKEIDNEHYKDWKNSDDRLQKLIRSRLTDDIGKLVKRCRTAKGVWKKLDKMFGKPKTYPYPSEVDVSKFVSVSFSRGNSEWKKQMQEFIENQGLGGFIKGTTPVPQTGGGDSSSATKEIKNDDYRSWKRSDDLVRGWIRSTLTEDIRQQVKYCRTAKGLWTKLEKMSDDKTEELRDYQPLQNAIIMGDIESATKFIGRNPKAISIPITDYSETALIIASKSKGKNEFEFLKNLLDEMSPEDVIKADVNGWTALHTAAIAENFKAAKLLVERNRNLLSVRDIDGYIPLFYADKFHNREMVDYLWRQLTEEDQDNLGARLLCDLITYELHDIALILLKRNPKLAWMEPSPLLALTQKSSSFRSGTPLTFLEWLIYLVAPNKLKNTASHHSGGDVENQVADSEPNNDSDWLNVKQRLRAMVWEVAAKFVPQIKQIGDKKLIHHQARELLNLLCQEIVKFSNPSKIFTPPLIKAISNGIPEIGRVILKEYPNVISHKNENRQTIIQEAIVWRCEYVFNHVYQLEDYRNIFFLIRDASENNALHLAGNVAPQQTLNRRAGSTLQMQRELQWFKEIENNVASKVKEDRNYYKKTPAQLFTETHKDLATEAERWMKSTADSYTIVATLIATVVFAAAITVPGGNNSDNGHPIFSKRRVFIVFNIFDALALFSSVTSMLMFLSIQTSRYTENDFLFTLPNRLIIGLGALFFSILSMMIAFGSTLYLVCGVYEKWVLGLIIALVSVPVTLFLVLQFPLFIDMIKSTYGPGIFGERKSNCKFIKS